MVTGRGTWTRSGWSGVGGGRGPFVERNVRFSLTQSPTTPRSRPCGPNENICERCAGQMSCRGLFSNKALSLSLVLKRRAVFLQQSMHPPTGAAATAAPEDSWIKEEKK